MAKFRPRKAWARARPSCSVRLQVNRMASTSRHRPGHATAAQPKRFHHRMQDGGAAADHARVPRDGGLVLAIGVELIPPLAAGALPEAIQRGGGLKEGLK